MARSTTYTLLLLCRVAVPAMLACVAWWLKQIHTYLQILTQSSFLSWQMHATRSKAFAIHTKKALTNIIYCLAKSGSVGAMVISKNANQIVEIKGPESWWIAKSITISRVVNQSKVNPQRPKGVVD